jgi:hypothetical protein
MRSDARAIDAAYQAVVATAQPIRRTLSGGTDEDIARVLRLASASRNHSCNLVVDIENSILADVDSAFDVGQACGTLRASIEIIAEALIGPRDGTYTRSSALFDQTERQLEVTPHRVDFTEFALRDFRLIDGTMASVAELIGLNVTDFDTVDIRS